LSFKKKILPFREIADIFLNISLNSKYSYIAILVHLQLSVPSSFVILTKCARCIYNIHATAYVKKTGFGGNVLFSCM